MNFKGYNLPPVPSRFKNIKRQEGQLPSLPLRFWRPCLTILNDGNVISTF